MKTKLLLIISVLSLGLSNYLYADYPIMSHSYLADPGAIWFEGRLYVYCSNDNENPEGGSTYDMSSVVCVSSADLKNWTDHGIVFDVPRDASWTGLSWAPSPAYKDGKFYLYFGNGGSAIGVAVADNPLGPFVDPVGNSIAHGRTPGVQPFDGWLFDPMTFVDDDGQAYMYFGGNGENNMRVAKLNDDMVSINGDCKSIKVPYLFEAAWLHKHNGTYYFSYSTNPSNGMRIDYMTSKDPMSGFTYGGVMSGQPPINNNNNHQAVVKVEDKWYQVYHNRIVARDNLGTDEMPYHRNLAIDEFTHNADGSIKKMVNTVDGVKQIHYLDPFIRQEGETFSNQKGINTEVCSAGGMDLAYIDNGDWTMVEGVDFGSAGASSFTASVASPNDGGEIEIRIGSPTGTLAGTLSVPNTGGFQDWKTELITLNSKITGVKNVYFVYSTGGFNFDHWQFYSSGPIVDISVPSSTEGLNVGDEITITATATPQAGTISKVVFMVDGKEIETDNSAPYSVTYTITDAGVHTLSAVATDSNNDEGVDEVQISVQGPFGGTSHAIPGTIEFEEYDLGGNGSAYFDDSDNNTGGADYRMDEDVDLEECTDTDGGYNLGYTAAGEWVEYTVDVAKTETYDLNLRVSCSGADRTVTLAIDGSPIAKDIAIPNTGGWQAWEDLTINDISLDAGTHVLRLTIGDVDYVNLNNMTFSYAKEPVVISLKKGWNLIGYPLQGSSDIETALSGILDNVILVKDFDGYYEKGGDSALNSLQELERGKGYYIKVDADCILQW